ncbi:hypothetical protein [Roseateles flavus]|uniref:Uncharacterized protein n=1 Tax=Roseateles flavus TaxID=3149041 RepID=A0ABV0GKY1_9BURK
MELFIVESELEYPDPTGGACAERERSVCVLVLIAPGEAVRRQIRSESARYVGARCHIQAIEGKEWAAAAADVIHQRPPAFADIVMGLPEFCDEVREQVEQLHSLLTRQGIHRMGVWAAVADRPADWASLSCSLGFVRPAQGPSELGAAQLHAGLTQLGAPGLVECVAAEEVKAALGTPLAPAMCLTADLQGLDDLFNELGLPADRTALGPAVVFPSAHLGLAGYRRVVMRLRSMGLLNLNVVASHGLTLAPLVNAREPHMVLLIGPSAIDRPT